MTPLKMSNHNVVATRLESRPNGDKSPNLVTLTTTNLYQVPTKMGTGNILSK